VLTSATLALLTSIRAVVTGPLRHSLESLPRLALGLLIPRECHIYLGLPMVVVVEIVVGGGGGGGGGGGKISKIIKEAWIVIVVAEQEKYG